MNEPGGKQPPVFPVNYYPVDIKTVSVKEKMIPDTLEGKYTGI
jgi:hypothetical protein